VLDGIEVGEKSLDYALPAQETKPFLSSNANSSNPAIHWKPVDEADVALIAQRSKDRVAKEPQFVEIQKQLKDSADNKGIVRLAEFRKKAKADSEKDAAQETKDGAPKDSKEASKDRFKELQAAFTSEGVNVLADLITLSPGPKSAHNDQPHPPN
jgi:carboxyl-terminal processing protease